MAGGVSGLTAAELQYILRVGADTFEAEKEIGEMLGRVSSKATLGLATGGKWLGGLGGPLGGVGVGFDVASTAMGKFSEVLSKLPGIGTQLGPLVEQLAGVPSILKDITATLVNFAASASPGTFAQFTRALQDEQAIIGHTFIPVMELMTEVTRQMGDVLANILPDANETRLALDEFRGALAEFGHELKGLLMEIGPIIRDVIIVTLHELAHVLSMVAKALSYATFSLGLFLNMLGFRPGAPRTAEGAAARPAQIMGLSEYHQRNILAAYQEPGRLSAADQTAKATGQSASLLGSINQGIMRINTWLASWISSSKSEVPDTNDQLNKAVDQDNLGGEEGQAKEGAT